MDALVPQGDEPCVIIVTLLTVHHHGAVSLTPASHAVPPSLAFLERFWSFQPGDGAVFLSTKVGTAWTDIVVPSRHALPSELPNDGRDVYFTPNAFNGERRLFSEAQGKAVWLYADLDEIDPRTLTDLLPQVVWETSPGRYQAAWRLDEPLGPKAFHRLNKAVTYWSRADRGGWNWTKVLRVPGSVSTKHGDPWPVRVLWARWEDAYTASEVRAVAREALPEDDPATGAIDVPNASAAVLRRREWHRLGGPLRKLLRAKVLRPQDDRSAKLWRIYTLCCEAGLPRGTAVKLAQDTPYNKYRGQARELRQLWTEAGKAYAVAKRRQDEQARREGDEEEVEEVVVPKEKAWSFKPLHSSVFRMTKFPEPSWLVEDIWSKNAFGLWVGQEKAFKTTTLLDFVVSVTSGLPFLGKFEVKDPGPVLYLHNEGKPHAIERMISRLYQWKGLEADIEGVGLDAEFDWDQVKPLDYYVLSLSRFDLTDSHHKAELVKWVRVHRPRAVILETWYLLTPEIDENVAKEVQPVIQFLIELAEREQVAVIVSHHFKKGERGDGRVSDSVSGSSVFGRGYESRFSIERIGEQAENTARFHCDHRYESSAKFTIQVGYDQDGEDGFDVRFLSKPEEEEITNGGGPMIDMDAASVRPKKTPKVNGIIQNKEGERLRKLLAQLILDGEPVRVADVWPRDVFSRSDHFARILKENGFVVANQEGSLMATPPPQGKEYYGPEGDDEEEG